SPNSLKNNSHAGPPRTIGRSLVASVCQRSQVRKSVTWRTLPEARAAHLRIAGFEEGTVNELRKALAQIEQKPTNAIILDLRNNPGGLLNEAVAAASQFLGHGNVLLVKD